MMLVDKMAETRRALRDASKQVIVALNRMHEVEEQVNTLARALGNNNRKHASTKPTTWKVKITHDEHDGGIENWSSDVSTTAHRKGGETNSGRTKRAYNKNGNGSKIRALLADGKVHTGAEARAMGVNNASVYFNNEITAGRAKRVGYGKYRAI